jgi:hypothetical protein
VLVVDENRVFGQLLAASIIRVIRLNLK